MHSRVFLCVGGLASHSRHASHAWPPLCQARAFTVHWNCGLAGLSQLQEGVPILIRLAQHSEDHVKTNAMLALSYLCNGDSERIQVCFLEVEWAVIVFCQQIGCGSNHNPVLMDAVAASSLQVVVDALPMTALMDALRSDGDVRDAALGCVFYITCLGTDEQIQVLLDAGLLSIMGSLLRCEAVRVTRSVFAASTANVHPCKTRAPCVVDRSFVPVTKVQSCWWAWWMECLQQQTCKDACSALSYVTAGSVRHIQRVLDEHLFSILIEFMAVRCGFVHVLRSVVLSLLPSVCTQHPGHVARDEAFSALCNATNSGNDAQVAELVGSGAVQSIASGLLDARLLGGLREASLHGLLGLAEVGLFVVIVGGGVVWWCVYVCVCVCWGSCCCPSDFPYISSFCCGSRSAATTAATFLTSLQFWMRLRLCLHSRLWQNVETPKCAPSRCVC